MKSGIRQQKGLHLHYLRGARLSLQRMCFAARPEKVFSVQEYFVIVRVAFGEDP